MFEWDCRGQISLPHWDGWEIEKNPRAVLYPLFENGGDTCLGPIMRDVA